MVEVEDIFSIFLNVFIFFTTPSVLLTQWARVCDLLKYVIEKKKKYELIRIAVLCKSYTPIAKKEQPTLDGNSFGGQKSCTDQKFNETFASVSILKSPKLMQAYLFL